MTSAENADLPPMLEDRRLADYVVDKAQRGRGRVWLIAWLAVGPFVRSGLGGNVLRSAILRRFGARVGARVSLHRSVRVHFPWKLTLADDVVIGARAWLINPEPIVVGAATVIGSDVVVCSGGHDHRAAAFTRTSAPVQIGARCTLGNGVTVLKGLRLGSDSHVSPGSVVVARAPKVVLSDRT